MNNESVFSAPRVLVVEAELMLRQSLMRLLTEEGYGAAGVATLDEAWAIVDFRSFALILADLIVGKSLHSFTPAHILRRHTPTTPLKSLPGTSDGALLRLASPSRLKQKGC